MASGLSIPITAVDGFTGVIDKLNRKLGSIPKPFERLGASVENSSRSLRKFADVSGLSKVGKSFGEIGRQAGAVYDRLGQVVPLLGAITSAASVAGMYRLVSAWSDWGAHLGFAATRIGTTAGQLSTLQGAARLAGSSAEGMTSGLQALGQTLYDAVGGRAPETITMLNTLGIAMTDSTGQARKATDVLPEVADKIAKIADPFTQAQIAAQLFGGAAEDLLPFLRKGSTGMREYAALAQRYGVGSEAGAKAADRMREAQVGLSLSFEGLRNRIAERLAPVVTPMLTRFADWIATSPAVQRGIEALGGAVAGFGDYLSKVNWDDVGKRLEGWGQKFSWVVDHVGGLQNALKYLFEFMAVRFAISMVLPFVKLGAAITGATWKLSGLAGAWGGVALAGGFVADQMLRKIDPEDKTGAWIDRNISGASWLDHQASRIGLGRSYAEQAEVERSIGAAHTVDTTLSAPARGLLDTIAGPESHGRYDVMYGGDRFSDFSRHPGIAHPITSGPNAGRTSTAAGRYQFTEPTWNEAARTLGLHDFSPANQDRAAWWLAQRAYNIRTRDLAHLGGRDLAADLGSGDAKMFAGIGAALHGTWTSLPGGIEQGTNTKRFLSELDYNTRWNTPEAAAQRGQALALAPGAPPMRMEGGGVGAAGQPGAAGASGNVRLDITGSLPPGFKATASASGRGLEVGGPLVERSGVGMTAP